MGEGTELPGQPLSLTSCTHTPRGSTALSLACRPSTTLLWVPPASGSGPSSFSRWMEMTWWGPPAGTAPPWASVSGPGLWTGAWRLPPPSSPTPTQLRRPLTLTGRTLYFFPAPPSGKSLRFFSQSQLLQSGCLLGPARSTRAPHSSGHSDWLCDSHVIQAKPMGMSCGTPVLTMGKGAVSGSAELGGRTWRQWTAIPATFPGESPRESAASRGQSRDRRGEGRGPENTVCSPYWTQPCPNLASKIFST